MHEPVEEILNLKLYQRKRKITHNHISIFRITNLSIYDYVKDWDRKRNDYGQHNHYINLIINYIK